MVFTPVFVGFFAFSPMGVATIFCRNRIGIGASMGYPFLVSIHPIPTFPRDNPGMSTFRVAKPVLRQLLCSAFRQEPGVRVSGKQLEFLPVNIPGVRRMSFHAFPGVLASSSCSMQPDQNRMQPGQPLLHHGTGQCRFSLHQLPAWCGKLPSTGQPYTGVLQPALGISGSQDSMA